MAIRDCVKDPLVRLAVAAACSLASVVVPAVAQAPVAGHAPVPEIWYGLQRVDEHGQPWVPSPPPKPPVVAPVPDQSRVLFDSRPPHEPADSRLLPPAGSAPRQFGSRPVDAGKHIPKEDRTGATRWNSEGDEGEGEQPSERPASRTKEASPHARAEQIPVHDPGLLPAASWSSDATPLGTGVEKNSHPPEKVATPTTAVPAPLPPALTGETGTSPAEVKKTAAAAPAGEPPHSRAMEDGEELLLSRMLFNTVLVQSIVLLAALILLPGLLLLAACLAVRRALSRSGSLLRVEVVGTPGTFAMMPVAHGGMPANGATMPGSVPPDTPLVGGSAATPWEEEYTAQQFELGPTYEEELRLKEQGRQQQEEALLRQVFEENVRLREQLVG
jgi:hypothetical protein